MADPVSAAPLDADLFASLDPPRLQGSRCDGCGTTVFPVAGSCPRCSTGHMQPVALPERGTVWTYTVQGFAPKPPYVVPAGGFVPFPVAYVELGGLLVEGHLLAAAARLRIGLPVRLVLEDLAGGAVTYAFADDTAAADA